MKAQAAVMDALILLIICSATASLLFYVSSLYGSNTNRQILAVYNYEYANIALLSLRHITDDQENSFWETLKDVDHLGVDDPKVAYYNMYMYFTGNAKSIFQKLNYASPGKLVIEFSSRETSVPITFYCLESNGEPACFSDSSEVDALSAQSFSTFAVSTAIKDHSDDQRTWTLSFKMYF